jgi:hypothetical protein
MPTSNQPAVLKLYDDAPDKNSESANEKYPTTEQVKEATDKLLGGRTSYIDKQKRLAEVESSEGMLVAGLTPLDLEIAKQIGVKVEYKSAPNTVLRKLEDKQVRMDPKLMGQISEKLTELETAAVAGDLTALNQVDTVANLVILEEHRHEETLITQLTNARAEDALRASHPENDTEKINQPTLLGLMKDLEKAEQAHASVFNRPTDEFTPSDNLTEANRLGKEIIQLDSMITNHPINVLQRRIEQQHYKLHELLESRNTIRAHAEHVKEDQQAAIETER